MNNWLKFPIVAMGSQGSYESLKTVLERWIFCKLLLFSILPTRKRIFMPLKLLENIEGELLLGVWEISEELEELLVKGQHLITEEWEQIQAPSRKLEWLGSRVLLEQALAYLGESIDDLRKDDCQKPFLHHSPNFGISISHTKGLSAVAIHPSRRVGIDVEYCSPRIMRIKQKFVHEEEESWVGEDWRKVLGCWCAKEALYKLQGRKGAIFKDELRVFPTSSPHTLRGEIRRDGNYCRATLKVLEQSQYIIVYAVEQ